MGLNMTFDSVTEQYDRWRPKYAAELYRDIFEARPLDENSRVLEIGIGTGTATGPILAAGCRLTAVEIGENMARFAADRFANCGNFEVVNASFEDFEAEPGTYDLIFSATAFHWIPEETGYPKVYELLKPGGVFARFANRPDRDRGRPELDEAIQRIYAKYRPGSSRRKDFEPEDAQRIADIAGKYGFRNIMARIYRGKRDFTGEEYVGLLGTYSDNIALDAEVRRSFFGEIRETIERYGNCLTIYDVQDLELAWK